MPDAGFKLDKTINLSTVVMAVGLVITGSMWVQSVNNKLDDVAQIVVSVGKTQERLDELEREILVNRAETLKNRQVYQGRGK